MQRKLKAAEEETLDPEALDRLLRTAIEIAEEAGSLALGMRAKGLAPSAAKGRHDFVTAADVAVEDLIRKRLARACPGDAVLGEEGGGQASRSLWVVDPIDGTTNYAHGGDDWCVSIAHVRQGCADVGVVYAPALGRIHSARLGGGATCNGSPISMPAEVPADRALIEIDWGVELGLSVLHNLIERTIGAGLDFRRSGSCALALANVAAGRVDGYVEAFTRPWDALAGCVLVREANGMTNDFERGVFEAMGNPVFAGVASLFPTLGAIATAVTCESLRLTRDAP